MRALVAGLLTAACALLVVSPAPGQREERIPSHPQHLRFEKRQITIPRADGLAHTLSTATQVVVVEDPTLPLVEVTIALHAGRFLDPVDRPGLAELTGAMIRRGGSTSRSADEIDEAIDFLGTELNSNAGEVRAGVSLDCLSDSLEESLALLFELVATPAFQEDRLESARTSIHASLEARNDDPLDLMGREWDRLLYGPDHFRSRRITASQLASIERSDLVAFHREAWQPGNAVIAVAGDVKTEEVLELLETHVAGWQAAVRLPGAPNSPEPQADGDSSRSGIYLVGHATPQAKVSLGHSLPRARDWVSQEATTLAVLNEILGGTAGQISRINGRLRGREGIVYRALSEVELQPDRRGAFRIFLDAAPENVGRAVEVCLEEIERIQTTPVSERAISIVQEEFLSRLQLRFDSATDIAGYFAEDILLGRPHDYWYGYAARVRSVKPVDVQRAARRFLRPKDLALLAVGDVGTLRASLDRERHLARILGDSATVLPPRDPLTLEPLDPGH
jgi:zinc protease